MGKLTDRSVRNLKTPGRFPDGETLYLKIWPGGAKSWVQRLVIGGRRTDLGLGAYPVVSLAQARRKAQDNRALAKSGGDPLAEKREEAMVAATPTFEAWRSNISPNTATLGGMPSTRHNGFPLWRPTPSPPSARSRSMRSHGSKWWTPYRQSGTQRRRRQDAYASAYEL